MSARDLTRREFDRACARAGFRPVGFLGFYLLAPPVDNVSTSVLNAGPRLRDQLAYLHRQQAIFEKRALEGK